MSNGHESPKAYAVMARTVDGERFMVGDSTYLPGRAVRMVNKLNAAGVDKVHHFYARPYDSVCEDGTESIPVVLPGQTMTTNDFLNALVQTGHVVHKSTGRYKITGPDGNPVVLRSKSATLQRFGTELEPDVWDADKIYILGSV